MSHLVSLFAPIPGAHTVKKYAGFGILGADIPATGDNGGSPVLNDGILPGSEYYWRIEVAPSSGTLTIFPDLSFELDGAADGDWTWQYRLFEDGTDEGVATVSVHVGGHDVTIASSQQVNQASPASVQQTHLISVSDSQQENQSSAAAIQQTHKVVAADSQQSNVASAASVSQSSTSFISAANSIQTNQSDAAAIRQTHLLGVASSQQVNQTSAAAVLQVVSGYLIATDSQQINQASAAAVRQTHLIGVASSQQINRSSGAMVSDGTVAAVFFLGVSIEKRTRVGLTDSPVGVYLWQEIALENVYLKGEVVRLLCRVADTNGRDIDPPALSLMTRYGSGVPSELVFGIDPAIVRARQGRYYADVPLTERGTMYYRWETGADDKGAGESSIVVRGGRFQ